jgi:hypothetical protein
MWVVLGSFTSQILLSNTEIHAFSTQLFTRDIYSAYFALMVVHNYLPLHLRLNLNGPKAEVDKFDKGLRDIIIILTPQLEDAFRALELR